MSPSLLLDRPKALALLYQAQLPETNIVDRWLNQ